MDVLRNPRRTTCDAAEHVKFFVTELDNGDVGFADLTIQKLRECVAAFVAPLSAAYFPICALS